MVTILLFLALVLDAYIRCEPPFRTHTVVSRAWALGQPQITYPTVEGNMTTHSNAVKMSPMCLPLLPNKWPFHRITGFVS
jgi:hypothetical protein